MARAWNKISLYFWEEWYKNLISLDAVFLGWGWRDINSYKRQKKELFHDVPVRHIFLCDFLPFIFFSSLRPCFCNWFLPRFELFPCLVMKWNFWFGKEFYGFYFFPTPPPLPSSPHKVPLDWLWQGNISNRSRFNSMILNSIKNRPLLFQTYTV